MGYWTERLQKSLESVKILFLVLVLGLECHGIESKQHDSAPFQALTEVSTVQSPGLALHVSFLNLSHLLPKSLNIDKAGQFSKACSPTTQPYPDFPDDISVLVGFLPTTGGSISERLGLKMSGAFTYAVHRVNEENMLPEGYKIKYRVLDTKGDEIMSTGHVADLLCQGASAIFGPEHTCKVEATIAAAKNIPMISYACSDEAVSDKHFFKTFARTNPSEKHIINATLKVLLHFNWKKFSIIYMDEYFTMANELRNRAADLQLQCNHFLLYSDPESVFRNSSKETRIYVFIGHKLKVFQLLEVMAMQNLLTSKGSPKYMLIHVDRDEFDENFNWEHYVRGSAGSNSNSQSDYDLYSEALLLVSNKKPYNQTQFINKTREFNARPPVCQNKHHHHRKAESLLNIEDKHVPFFSAAYLYDSVLLYAQTVSALYNESRNSEFEATVPEIARNGTAIVNKLKNSNYSSVMGFNITMDQNAESEGRYSLYYVTKQCNSSGNVSLELVADVNKEVEMICNVSIHVLDEPECGYKNDKCPNVFDQIRQFLTYILAGLLIFCIFMSILMYRNWKYEQEISGLQWRLLKSELGQLNQTYMGGSRTSLMSTVSNMRAEKLFYGNLADFKGTLVCCKDIYFENKKVELSRNSMKEMRGMRQIKHDNVCAFIGAYVEANRIVLVTEYCTRGSLNDILENKEIKLDRFFISSLVQDLLRAINYLHSHFGQHGNLMSTNCVVTGRWVLQVIDYGLHELRVEQYRRQLREDPENLEYLKRQLWRAPELLRNDPFCKGTKEGDVYSFGIILHEIIGRHGPFSTSSEQSLGIGEIIREVIEGTTKTGTLRRPSLLDLSDMPFSEAVLNTMKKCWAEDKNSRPDFRTIRMMLKEMKDEKREDLMDHMVKMMEEYSKNLEGLVASKAQSLSEEMKKTEDLLHRMLPPLVASSLTKNIKVEPQTYEAVTIFFSDIVGFTALSATSSPYQVFNFLNELYTLFDKIIRCYDVYKVETIGDAYMVVSGLPVRNQDRHAGEIASMALELLHETKTNFAIPHKPEDILKLRIGLHTGPVIAGVVGLTMPRYCLFGDTVNTASRMESNGEPLRIHISVECNDALQKLSGYKTEERGTVAMKGKGKVLTYWLIGADSTAIQRRENPTSLPPVPLFQQNEETRRRSPRMSSDMRRNSLAGRGGIAKPEDQQSGGDQDSLQSLRDSPKLDAIAYHRRRLNPCVRSGSLEISTKGGLLSPPLAQRLSSHISMECGNVKGSHSLDRLPIDVQLRVPALKGIKMNTSPASSEPVLGSDDEMRHLTPLSPSDMTKQDIETQGEQDPMLDDDVDNVTLDFPSDSDSITTPVRARKAGFRTMLSSLMKPAKHPNSSKLPANGFARESVV